VPKTVSCRNHDMSGGIIDLRVSDLMTCNGRFGPIDRYQPFYSVNKPTEWSLGLVVQQPH
jgi:hypothetical protein